MTISAGSTSNGGGSDAAAASGPTVNVNDGADLGTVRASGNGTANINSGGMADRLEISQGGTGNVNSGGTVDTLSVSGGSSTASVSGTANTVNASGGGSVTVQSGGTVNNVSSGSGSTVNLESGSNASLSPDSGQGGTINTASGSNVTVQGNSSGGNQSQRIAGANFGSGTNISVGNSPFLTGSAAGDTISLGLEDNAFRQYAQGGNQRAVAGALDVLADSTSPRAQQILGGIVLAGDPQALFNDLSGQVYASAVQSGMATQRTFALGLRSRAEASAPVPGVNVGVPVLGYTGHPQPALPSLALAADAPFLPMEDTPVPGPAVAQGYGVFVGGYGGSLDYDGTGNVLGYDSDIYGGMIGVETGLAALGYGEGVAGIAFGYGRTDVDVTGSDAGIDSYQLGIYAGGNLRGFDLAASLGYGYQEVDVDRRIGLPSGSVSTGGDFDGHLLSASLSASYNLASGFSDGLVFAPKATYDMIYADYGDGVENGGTIADLRFHGGDYTQHIAGIGLLLGAETALNGVVLRPEVEIMYEHVGGDSQIAQTLSFAGTDAAFAVASSAEVDERMRVGAGLGIGFTDDLSAKVSYEGIFGDDLEGHSVAASLRLAF
ncbi:MAG TPA: autotransporter domain-containing protein [Aurantimonas sp.]|nr:autotransporter domain-containing protein [Aurantimonas sp.]